MQLAIGKQESYGIINEHNQSREHLYSILAVEEKGGRGEGGEGEGEFMFQMALIIGGQ